MCSRSLCCTRGVSGATSKSAICGNWKRSTGSVVWLDAARETHIYRTTDCGLRCCHGRYHRAGRERMRVLGCWLGQRWRRRRVGDLASKRRVRLLLLLICRIPSQSGSALVRGTLKSPQMSRAVISWVFQQDWQVTKLPKADNKNSRLN